MAWNQDEILRWYRSRTPGKYIGVPDEEVYEAANDYAFEKYGKNLRPYIPKQTPPNSVGNIPVNPGQDDDKSNLSKVDVSPNKLKGLYKFAAGIGTDISAAGFLAEMFPEGLDLPGETFDISPEFFQKSYNESLAGQAYQAIHGREAYNTEDYTNDDDLKGWLAESGQFLLGMVSAPEVAAFATGTKLGLWGARAGTSALHGKALLGLRASAIKKGAVKGVENRALKTAMVHSALETGMALGTLGAAHSATHSAAVQKMNTGEIDYQKVFIDGAKGFGESFLVGAPAGMVAKGLMGSQYAMAKLGRDGKTLDLTKKVLFGLPSQIGVEALAFTALPSFYRYLGEATGVPVPEAFKQAPGILDKGFGRAFFNNTVVIGTMVGFGHANRKMKGIDDTHAWALKLLEQGKRDIKKVQNSTENVRKSLEEAGVKVDPEMLKLIGEETQKAALSEKEYNDFKTNQKTVKKLIEKIESQGSESLTTKELKQLEELSGAVKLVELGSWEELASSDRKLRKVIEEKEGRTITDEEFNIYKTALETKMNDTIQTFADLNELMVGFNPNKPIQQAGAKTPTTVITTSFPKTYVFGKGTGKKIVYDAKQEQKLLDINKGTTNPDAQWKLEQPAGQLVPGQPSTSQTQQNIQFQQQVKAVKTGLVQTGIAPDYVKNISKAKTLITEVESEVFKQIGQVKGSQNSTLIKTLRKNMKDVDVNSGDIEAVLGFALHKFKDTQNPNWQNDNIKFRKYSSTISKFVNWLNKTKNKKLSDVEYSDLHEYLVGELQAQKKGKIKQATSGELAAFAKFFEYADRRFMPRGAGREIRDEISWTDINEYITERLVEVDTKVLKDVNKNVQTINKELQKTLSGTNLEKATGLSVLIKYGLRDQEMAKLTKANIGKSKNEGYYIDFGVGKNVPKIFKNKTFANAIPIPENVAEFLLKIKTKDNFTPIFGKGLKIKNKSLYAHIASSVFGNRPDGAKYEWNNNRTLLRSKGFIEKADKGQMNGYLRHDKTRIEKIYEKLSIDEQLQIYKKLQKELGISDAPGKFQLEGIGPPASAKELAPWLDAQIKKNPGLVLKKLKDADFVGRFYEGVIDVTMGKANKFTFFHENAHRLKSMIDASGNKRLSKVWNQAEKLFKKEAKGRNMEEFLADEIAKYSLKREQSATLKQKMGGWLNRVWSTVKSVFFGKERLSKNDVKNILGEKVFKGFEFNANAKASSIARYKYATTEEFSKGLKKQFEDSLTDKLKPAEKRALEEYIATTSGMENPELFKLGSSGVNEADLVLFQERMKDIPFLEIKSSASTQQKAKLIRNIELNGKKVFTPKTQQNIMKLLGFKSKTLWGATVEQLKGYSDMVNSTRMPNQTRRAGIAESATSGELSDIMREMDGLIGDAAKATLPVGAVMRRLGLKDIASKLEDHISVELNHVGEFILFETVGERLLGKRTFKKAKEHLYLMDVERYIERKNLGLITRGEQKFIDKAFKNDWIVKKDGKLVKNSKYNGKKFKDAINKETPQGQIVDAWVNYTDYVFKSFKEAVKANMSEAEYLNFINDNNINWIRDNIYVSRLVTNEFKKVFRLGGKAYDKLIEKQTAPLAEKLAKKKYNTDRPTDEQIGSVWEDAQMYVKNDIADMLQFNQGKHSTRFLMKRHTKLPEFVEIDGKKIKVYETAYENTVKKYALGMSKFMANTEVFPEFVKLKGMNFPGRKDAINKLIAANNKWGAWAKDRVDQQLGYLQRPASAAATGLSGFAQILAKTQLSFPTSGLKNLVLGQTATLQAFRIRDYFSAIAKVMSREFRDEVKGTGATEVGLRHIQDFKFKRIGGILDKIFWFGGMKPTENANRYMSIAASKIQQARLVKIIQNKMSPAKKVTKAERRLKDFYSITGEELKLLKKYGMSNVDDVSFTSAFAKAKERRVMQNIYNKMNSMAHIKTQGASLSLFMPEWADRKFLRPLTLFKRMAYAATTNSINNFKLAYRNRDMMKMGMHMLGPYLTGTALIAAYDMLFDQKPPTENSDGWAHMKYVYLRGEFLGVLSDFIKMYEGESAQQTVYPALYNYLQTSYMTLGKLYKGQMNWGQTGEEMAKASFGAYRGVIKLIDKRENQYHIGTKRVRNLWYEFLDETFPNELDDGIGERKLNRRSPYYTDLKTVFNKGTTQEFVKQYVITLFAVATDLYNEGVTAEGASIKYSSFDEAFKQASSNLKTKLTKLNPNPGSIIKAQEATGKTRLKYTKMAIAWDKWLKKDKVKYKEYSSELLKLEGEYHFKIRKFKEYLNNNNVFKDPELQRMVAKEIKKLK